MARPILTKGSALSVSSISSTNNWQDSAAGLTTLQVLQGASATEYVYGIKLGSGTPVTGPLILAMNTFSPAAANYMYGVLFEFTAVGCVTSPSGEVSRAANPYVDIPVRVSIGAGVRNFTLSARNMLTPDGTYSFAGVPAGTAVGDTRQFFIYTFDQRIQKWDMSFAQVEVFMPRLPLGADDIEVTFRQIRYWPLYFTPTAYSPILAMPPHVWDPATPGVVADITGGHYRPAAYSTFFANPNTYDSPDVPDAVRLVMTNQSSMPQGAVLQDFGLIVPRADDLGIVVPRVDFPNSDVSAKPAATYLMMSCGWLVPATADYYWSDWNSQLANQTTTRPVQPVHSATINGDQVDITGFSCDNLLPLIYSGVQGTIPGGSTDATLVVPGANVSFVFNTPYDATQRSNQILNFQRATSIGIILMSSCPFPVQVGKTYVASAYFRTSIATTTTFSIDWRDINDANISTATLGSGNQTTRTLFTGGPVTAPAGATHARLQVATGSVAIGTTMDLDSLSVSRYNGVSIPQYNTGGYIWGNAAGKIGSAQTVMGQLIYHVETDSPNQGVLTETGAAPRTGFNHMQFVAGGSCTLVIPFYGHYLAEAMPTGTVVSVRAWMRSVTTQGQVTLGLRFLDSAGNTIQDSWSSTTALTSTSTYALYKAEGIIVPTGAVAIELLIGLPGGAITYYIDDIGLFFTPTCPPTAMPTPAIPSGAPQALQPTAGCVAYYVLERQLVNSTTWTPIAIQQVNPLVDFAYSDYAVPEGMSWLYRARILGLQDGVLIEGQYSTFSSLGTSSPGLQWTLWDPSSDAKGPLRFDINADDGHLDFALQSALALYSPVGRNRRVLTKDTSKGRSFKFEVDIISAADFALWEIYHQDRNVLILTRTSTGENWPVVISSDLEVQVRNTTPTQYMIKLTLEEVDVPSVW